MTRKLITIIYNTSIYVVKSRLPLIKALQEAGYDVAVLSPVDEATPELIANGVVHYPITMSQYGMNPIKELRSVAELKRLLATLKPVATLNYTIKPNIFGTIAAHRAGVPVLNNIAGAGRAFSGGNPMMRKLVIGLYRQALKHSHTVFFQNGDDMAIFQEAGLVREAQCVRIPGSGVDLTRFQPTPLPNDVVRFLFIGRLLNEKGICEFLTAANALMDQEAYGNVSADIVGEHEADKSFIASERLESLTEHPRITYHGTVAPSQIDGFIQSASCVVLPSYYGEGVPRVLLEACASGRPIITTDNVGCRDVVEPGINGWKVAPRDTSALTEAMQAFADMPAEQRASLGKAARHTAVDRFDEKIVIGAYLDRLARL